MSHEFKPGHPVIFWTLMLFSIFFIFSAAKAVMTVDDCGGDTGAQKAWQVFPPEWACGEEGRIKF